MTHVWKINVHFYFMSSLMLQLYVGGKMCKTNNNLVYFIESDVPDYYGHSKRVPWNWTGSIHGNSWCKLQAVALNNKPLQFFHPPEGGLEFQHQFLLTRSENKPFRCLAAFTTIPRASVPVLWGQILRSLHLCTFSGSLLSAFLLKCLWKQQTLCLKGDRILDKPLKPVVRTAQAFA